MKLTVDQCFLTCGPDAKTDAVAWSEGLSTDDVETMRGQAHALPAGVPLHHQQFPLGTKRMVLSRTYASQTQPSLHRIHNLVFPLEALAAGDLFLMSLCVRSDIFLSLCPYRLSNAPQRTIEWAEPEEEELLTRLSRMCTRAQLVPLISAAVLATADHPLIFVPSHPSQALPWFESLMACVPPTWRSTVTFSTAQGDAVWLSRLQADEPTTGTVWSFDTPLGQTRMAYASALARYLSGGKIGAASKVVHTIESRRPAETQAAMNLLDSAAPDASEETGLVEAARWTRREHGHIL